MASPLIQRGAAQNNTAPNDAARPGAGSGERLPFGREVTSLGRTFSSGLDQSEVPFSGALSEVDARAA